MMVHNNDIIDIYVNLSKHLDCEGNLEEMLRSEDYEVFSLAVSTLITYAKEVYTELRVFVEYYGDRCSDSGEVDAIHINSTPYNKDIVDIIDGIDGWEMTECTNYDWYNNDGGRGTITIDLLERTVAVDGVQYYTEEAEAQNTLEVI